MSPYQQIRLSACRLRLSERVEGVLWWTPAEATRAINEALRIWSALTGFWRRPILVSTVPNDPFVAVPGTMVQPTTLTWDGWPLERASLADFDWGIPNWRATTTATPGAPDHPIYWAPISANLLAIYPADAYLSVQSTHTFLVNGVSEAPQLVQDTDFLDLGEEHLDTLLGYAQHVLAFKIGGETLVASYPGWQRFLLAAAAFNQRLGASVSARKYLGLDQQRRLFPEARLLQTPADLAAAIPPDV